MSPEEYRRFKASLPAGSNVEVSTDRHDPVWKQSLKDLPIAMAATGIGYGIGKTVADAIADNLHRTGQRPNWLKYMPAVAAALPVGFNLASRATRNVLLERRQNTLKAEREGTKK